MNKDNMLLNAWFLVHFYYVRLFEQYPYLVVFWKVETNAPVALIFPCGLPCSTRVADCLRWALQEIVTPFLNHR